MRSGHDAAAGCVVWCGLVGGGAGVGVLAVIVAAVVGPTPADAGPLAGAGLIGVLLWRAVLAGLAGAVAGGAVAGWAVGRLRRRGGGRAEPDGGPDRGGR